MAAQFTKEFLTGAPDGAPVTITATGAPFQVLHTVPAGVKDEVWLYAVDQGPNDEQITIEFGAGAKFITQILKKQIGLTLIVPGLPLAPGAVVKAYVVTANAINVVGFVNRITP